jgi:dihydrofolate synthase/folylpolyglutamate synthase
LLVLDGAHNGESAQRLRQALDLHFRYERLRLVLGVFADKDLPAILRPFQGVAHLYATEADHPRARPAAEIVRAARRLGYRASPAGSVPAALEAARAEAGPNDLICLTGSLAVVAAGRETLGLWP